MRRKTVGARVVDALIYAVAFISAVSVIVPMISVVSMSLVSAKEIATRQIILFPEVMDFSAYNELIKSGSVLLNGYKITLFRIIVGTTLNLVFSYFVAYALAKRDLVGKSAITFFFFFTMLFSGGLVPTYIVVKTMGFINNIWVYVIPGLVSVWNMLLIRNFIMTIPDSLSESADIDGASDVVIIFRIVLPLTVPSLITVGLFYAVGHWNAWWDAFLYTSKPDLAPVQLVLRNILARTNITINALTGGLSQTDVQPPPARSIQNAAVVMTTIPIVCVYPFLQKYFIKGVMVGAVKG